MRLLMILALLLSAIAMARPAPAEAASAMADCHSAVAQDDAPAGTSDQPRALGHTCPGCAAFAPPVAAVTAMERLPLPRLARTSVQRASILSAPLQPPPRPA